MGRTSRTNGTAGTKMRRRSISKIWRLCLQRLMSFSSILYVLWVEVGRERREVGWGGTVASVLGGRAAATRAGMKMRAQTLNKLYLKQQQEKTHICESLSACCNSRAFTRLPHDHGPFLSRKCVPALTPNMFLFLRVSSESSTPTEFLLHSRGRIVQDRTLDCCPMSFPYPSCTPSTPHRHAQTSYPLPPIST